MTDEKLEQRLQHIEQEVHELRGGYETLERLYRWQNDRLMVCEDKVNEELGLWDDQNRCTIDESNEGKKD